MEVVVVNGLQKKQQFFTRELVELLGFTFYFVVLVVLVRLYVSQIKAFL
jgi:hypothetical protein